MAIQAVIGLAIGAYNVYNSIRKNAQAKKLAAQNKRPVYNPDGTIQQVYDMATADLDNTYLQDYANQNAQQGSLAGIDAILKSGGSLDFESAYSRYGQNLNQSLAQLVAARDRKMANYNNAAYNVAASKDAGFQYNQDAPYKDNKQYEAQLRADSNASLGQGLSNIVSSVADLGIGNNKPDAGLGGDTRERSTATPETVTASSLRQPAATIGAGAELPGAVSPTGMSVNRYGVLTGYDHFGEPIYA